MRGDFDGIDDIAIFRPSNGTWYIIPSSHPGSPIVQAWGTSGDIPVPGDYDGSGKSNIAMFRPSNGTWYIVPAGNPGNPIIQAWGADGDLPVPVDYDGDGITDITVLRPSNGVWYSRPSSSPGTSTATAWGAPGDTPIEQPVGSPAPAVAQLLSQLPSSQFCAVLTAADDPGFVTPPPSSQQTCGLGTISLGVPENSQTNFWGAIQGGVCSTAGWPPADLNGFSCTWPLSFKVYFNEPVQSIALVSTMTTNNGPVLTACTQDGVGNILDTFTNPNPNPNAIGTVTITQSTSSFSPNNPPTPPADCSVVAFDVNGEAMINVGLQLSGGGQF